MLTARTFDFTNTPISARRPAFGYAPADPLAAPAVSIVTPFYNTGDIFHETARSVLGQSFQQWEWLIINDGSSDPLALAILDGYRRRDPRIRVIDHGDNRGLSAARNTGFDAARTPFVVQLDSDDLLETTAIEKWLWFLVTHPEYGFVKGYSVGFGAKEYLWREGFQRGVGYLQRNWGDPSAMIRTAVHRAAGGYDEAMRQGLEDWDFWLRCANAGHWGGMVPEFLDWHRCRPGQTERWQSLQEEQLAAFRDDIFPRRYPRLWQDGGFPRPARNDQTPARSIPAGLPCANTLAKGKRRLLLLAPRLDDGQESMVALARAAAGHGWEITAVAAMPARHEWLPHFAQATRDVFELSGFLRPDDIPRFLRYLISSRRHDAVLLTGGPKDEALRAYLHRAFPALPIIVEESQHAERALPLLASAPMADSAWPPYADAQSADAAAAAAVAVLRAAWQAGQRRRLPRSVRQALRRALRPLLQPHPLLAPVQWVARRLVPLSLKVKIKRWAMPDPHDDQPE